MNLEKDGGPPFEKLKITRVSVLSSLGVAGSGIGRYLCWPMAVELGRSQSL